MSKLDSSLIVHVIEIIDGVRDELSRVMLDQINRRERKLARVNSCARDLVKQLPSNSATLSHAKLSGLPN